MVSVWQEQVGALVNHLPPTNTGRLAEEAYMPVPRTK